MKGRIKFEFQNDSPYYVVIADYHHILGSHFDERSAIEQIEKTELIANGYATVCHARPGETVVGELVVPVPRPVVEGPEEIEPFFRGAYLIGEVSVDRLEIREDFQNRDEAYAIMRGEDGRFAFAWGPKYPYADEVPAQDVRDGESGLEWYATEHEARAAMNEATDAWNTQG